MTEINQQTLDTIGSLGGISTLAAISRTILSEDRRSFIGFVRGIVLALFVALMTGMLIQDYKFSASMSDAIVGIAAFVADDILMLVLKLAKMITTNPGKALDWLIQFLTGIRKGKR